MDQSIFADRNIFLTGGSGFLGTALACKILVCTACPSLTLLCRGGKQRLFKVWQEILPQHLFERLREDCRIEVLDGDICKEDLGLESTTIADLQERINVVIHAASSINLRYNLKKIGHMIIQGTLNVTDFALGCTELDRFVYVSTAYANSHLHHLNPQQICRISEQIYPLQDGTGSESDAATEWMYLQKYGTTPEYQSTPFPWAYAYAKHLTERLITDRFGETIESKSPSSSSTDSTTSKADRRLLIIRPSIVGPAQVFPEPGWQVATSAPVTGLAAFFIVSPARRLTLYSEFRNPNQEALIDEVPVDTVVNRIIIHTHMNTSGVVHANRELAMCYRFTDYHNAAKKLRRMPWDPKIMWVGDINSPKISEIGKLYAVAGCTFEFEQQKTSNVWSTMHSREKIIFPLFSNMDSDMSRALNLSGRSTAFESLFSKYFKKHKWPAWCLPIVYRN